MSGYLSFTGQAGSYAELPLSVLPGATTFTIEAKISTTSTNNRASNWTWGTIAGREIADHWQDDFGFCVNDGKLCFWAEPKAKNSLTQGTGGVVSNAVVNDGEVHEAAVVSSNSAIYLYCDGELVASQSNVNAKTPTSQTILLAYDTNANSYLQMDLYEARFWNVARTQEQIFTDIDDTETGLQAWYLPSEDGLLDYSGNGRHATLYGNPAYKVNVDLTFDVARIVRNYPKLLEGLAVWLPFDVDATTDLCGNTWTAYGNPTVGTSGAISGKALQLDGSSYLQKSGSISLGGKDFTIRGWFNVSSSASGLGAPLCIYQGTTRFISLFVGNEEGDLWLRVKEQAVAFNSVRDVRQFIEIDYSHSSSITRVFVDGVLAQSIQQSLSRTSLSFVALGNGTWNTSNNFVGSIDEFQIYDGIALHTANFTPPTAEDYFGLKRAFGGPIPLSLSFDVARRISNRVEFSADVARIITNSRFITVNQSFDVARKIVKSVSFTADVARTIYKHWRYVNLGTGDDMIIYSVNHYDLPATKSITGIAFGQFVRAKCFDIPATPEIWLKFDVYFDGSNRWRAYNDKHTGSGKVDGICSQSTTSATGIISFFGNATDSVYQAENATKKNQLQTVLLHMISGTTDGVVEAWVDGTKIYRYTGNVNNGEDFADIYLQSDGLGTYFSNVLISNARIGLNDGYKTFSADVVRRVKNRVTFTVDVERYLFKPIHVPLIGEHFCHFVKNRTLHRGVVQRIILPKNSKVYVRASDEGTVKIFSDTDNSGVTTDDIYAELDECNTVFIEYAPLNTSLQVIKNFMFALSADDDTLGTLNAAINYCTNGSIPDITTLANQLISDLNSSVSYTDFLRDYCDIILDNADTGAIIGSDAGSGTAKTAENIVPENIPVENWIIPEGGSVVTIDGLSVHFPTTGANGILSDVEKHILAGLNSVWIKQSLKLINKSFGLNFNSADVYVRDIDVSFIDDSTNSAVASVAVTLLNNIPDELELIINMAHCQYIDLTSADGLITRDDVYLDRILAHEFTHAVMASNISFYSKLPNYIREGAAELVHGIDDLRREEIITLLTTYKNSFYHNIIDFDDILLSYAAGYVILRYLSKQGQRDIPLPTTFQLNNLLISNGATDSDYNVLTDNTRQIFSADVARTLAKRLSFSLDVTIRDVIRVSFTADVARAILAELILFPINTLLRSKSSPRLRASQQNTQGLQSFEVNIGEQQITEQINFAGIIPFDILQQVSGQYLDYHFNMRVEKVQQEGIIYRCECCSDLDQLLFTQLAYKIPPSTWRKVGADDTTVEIETYYPPATAHVQKIASALGLTPVMQFDNFLSTVLMDDLGGVTYNDLIRDVFGWSSRIPHKLINCYIRDGKLYVIQRGHEANTVDISNAKCTMPVITKELVRTTWGSTPWSKTKTTEFQHTSWQAGVPDDVTIIGGGSSDTGGGSSDTGGGSTVPSGDDEDEKVREVSTQFSGNGYRGHTTYTYDRNGLLIQTYTYVEKDINGSLQKIHTTVNHDYDDDDTMIFTETFVQSFGAEGESSSRSIEEKGYTVLPNGEKFLAWESSTTYQNDEGLTPTNKDLVDSKVTVHSPSRVGQTHTITIGTDGEIIGSAAGQNTGDDRVTPFSKYKTAALGKNLFARTSSSISGGNSGGSSGGSSGEWTTETETETETYELTTNGLSLYDSSFPIHNEAKLIQVTQALRWLNRKTQETLTISVYEFPHLIDFNDRVVFNGKSYFLVNNTATTTPRIFNEQNLTLRRWY